MADTEPVYQVGCVGPLSGVVDGWWEGEDKKGRKIKKYTTFKTYKTLLAPTSRWRPFGPLDFALRALRPCDPRRDTQSDLPRIGILIYLP